MTRALEALIAEARGLANDHPCATSGHVWEWSGGRACPNRDDLEWVECSMSVFVCVRCGSVDYGERGGPGDRECRNHCRTLKVAP